MIFGWSTMVFTISVI